ncbi:phosphatase PAP2 family protein [Haloactinopolyspora sp.]|uniref:phosphatase PAP2 family protein n=1 Tax=Haloactinopolyspora sp. TaxID=1966353 RepID=UPI0026130109|nr:phosphatase PAP2 family protein [Haloactinopolyspora sp.]
MTDVDSAAASDGAAEADGTPPARSLSDRRATLARLVTPGRVGLAVYGVVLLVYCATQGIPMDRIGQTGWILIGIVAGKLGQSWRAHVRTFVDWLPLLAALVLYDHTRGVADGLGMPVRVGELVDIEHGFFGGTLPTVWLQTHLLEESVRWWDVGVAIVYFTHFVVPWLLAAAFYLYSRPRWVTYIRRVLLLSYAGLLTYVLLPAAPPWYAARDGLITEPVYRLVGRGWEELGLRSADEWLAGAQAQANLVAAMPSLHAAFALLVTVTLWPLARHWALRVVLVLFPLAMAFSLVYGGEHYVIDVVLGWAYVAVVHAAACWWERRPARQLESAAQPAV